MASASPDKIAITDHAAQAVPATALSLVSRVQAATGAS